MAPHRVPLAILLVLLSVAVGGSTCGLAVDDTASTLERLAINGLGFELFLGILAFAGAVLSPGDVRDRLGLRAGRLSRRHDLLLVAGTLGASSALDGLLDLTGLDRYSALWEFEKVVAGVRGSDWVLSLLAFVLAPGICEELLCRGLVQRGLVRRFDTWRSILAAAAIFGALHLDPVHAVFAAMLGVYLGCVCHLAGSVRSAVACHLANNCVALLAAVWLPTAGGDGATRLCVGAAAAAFALGWVWRHAAPPPPVDLRGSELGPSPPATPTDAP